MGQMEQTQDLNASCEANLVLALLEFNKNMTTHEIISRLHAHAAVGNIALKDEKYIAIPNNKNC